MPFATALLTDVVQVLLASLLEYFHPLCSLPIAALLLTSFLRRKGQALLTSKIGYALSAVLLPPPTPFATNLRASEAPDPLTFLLAGLHLLLSEQSVTP